MWGVLAVSGPHWVCPSSWHVCFPGLYCSGSRMLCISVQFSCSVVSDSLPPQELQNVRPPCPSLTAGVYPNPCPLSRWCHPVISSSVIPFSCPQYFTASGSFQMSQFFASGGQSIRVLASTSVLPMNIQDWFPLGWTGLGTQITKLAIQYCAICNKVYNTFHTNNI